MMRKRIKILVALLTAAMLAMNTPVISHAEIAGEEQSEDTPGKNSGNLPYAPEKIEGSEESTQIPEGENRKPEESTQTPEGENRKPEESAQTPEGENRKPEESTQTPEGENRKPEESTQTPEGENRKPEESAQTPEGEDQLPGQTTENSTPNLSIKKMQLTRISSSAKNAPEPEKIVAESTDGNRYQTLQDAINAANLSAVTITLIADIEENVHIAEGQDITLNLNGHKIVNGKESKEDTIINEGSLTIRGNGNVDNTVAWKAIKASAVRNEKKGTCYLEGGEFTRSKENNDNNSYYVLLNRGDMTINDEVTVRNQDGDYSSLIENGYFDAGDNTDGKQAKLVINGGTFIGGRYNVKNDEYGILEINGGNFSIDRNWNILNCNYLTVNGGSFENTSGSNIYAWMDWGSSSTGGTMKIKGGKFKTSGSYGSLDVETDLSLIEITGGTFDNVMETGNWGVSKKMPEHDVATIPEAYTKIAVGTDDEKSYIFKVVPVETAPAKEVELSTEETIDLADWENSRVQKLYSGDSTFTNEIRTQDGALLDAVETDIVKAEYLADVSGVKLTAGKTAGTQVFTIEYANSKTNPDKYVIQPVNVKVIEKKGYTIEYYYDDMLADSKSYEGKMGETISVTEEGKIPAKAGYRFDRVSAEQLTIGENPEENILKVYFVREQYAYTVEYYFDGVKKNEATGTGTFGDPIPYEKEEEGFVFDKLEGNALIEVENNILKVYYKTVGKGEDDKTDEDKPDEDKPDDDKPSGSDQHHDSSSQTENQSIPVQTTVGDTGKIVNTGVNQTVATEESTANEGMSLTSAQTGDTTNVFSGLALFAVGLAAILWVGIRKKRQF